MYESLAEIIAVLSILIKFGQDHIAEDKHLFAEFLNEIGIRIDGKKVTAARIFELTQNITHKERARLITEFNVGHEPIYRKLAMYTNFARTA